MTHRSYGRSPREARPVTIEPGFTKHAEGSALISFGDTRVICTASVEPGVPGWMRGSGKGWITAEYGMLPRATHTRSDREAARGRVGEEEQHVPGPRVAEQPVEGPVREPEQPALDVRRRLRLGPERVRVGPGRRALLELVADEPERVGELEVVARRSLAVARGGTGEIAVVRVPDRRPGGEDAAGEKER